MTTDEEIATGATNPAFFPLGEVLTLKPELLPAPSSSLLLVPSKTGTTNPSFLSQSGCGLWGDGNG